MKNFASDYMSTFQNRFNRALDIVFPPRCIVSGEEVEKQGQIAPKIWTKLSFITSPFCSSCGVPFEFDLAEGETQICTDCLNDNPPYETARSALIYDDTSRDLILGFKHADKMHAAVSFMPWLKRAGEEMLQQADFLVPVPLHPFRLIKRRYNQAAVLAQYLSRETDIHVLVDGLRRTRATQSQGHLDTKSRAKNVRKAFAINPKHIKELEGKNIVLIDDVYTTGSTVKECTKTLLKEAKVARVGVLCIARVVKN